MNFEFEHFIGRWIEMALKYAINPGTLAVFNGRYNKAQENWHEFQKELQKKKLPLNDIEKGNLYQDLKDILKDIDLYLDFYSKNIVRIKDVINEPYPVGKSPYSVEINPYSVLNELCKDTKKEIEKLKPTAPDNPIQNKQGLKETEQTLSFKYNTKAQKVHLENILDKLKQNDKNIEYVMEGVKITDFKRIFNYTTFNKISPIEWGKSIAALRYFIMQFSFDIPNKSIFKITAHCFTHQDKALKYEQIKNAKQVSKKDKKTIDSIFKLYPIIK